MALCFGLCACGTPDPLRHSLEAAGENRAELEKVLEHYSQHPADSLKLKAARFLIANMSGKHSYDSPDIRRFYREADSVFQDTAIHDLYDRRLDTLLCRIDFQKVKMIPDLTTVTSDLLIANIDSAFIARQRYDWCRQLSFSDFCEYVLPYRAGTAPLEEWRSIMYKRFAPVVDSLIRIGVPDTVICKAIGSEYVELIHYPPYFKPHYPPSSLVHLKAAPCVEWSNFTLYALRTFGLPMASDYTPFWAKHSMGHEWSVLLSPQEELLFMIGEKIQRGHQKWFDDMAKVYRRTASVQKESLAMQLPDEEMPEQFRNPYIKDVSNHYFDTDDITLSLEYDAPVPKKVAYIMVYNNQDWRPIHWGMVQKGEVTFTQMNRMCIYIAMYYHEGRYYPASEPFYTDKDGNLHYLHPDMSNMETVGLKWKYPDSVINEWCERIVNGRFQVANRSDFTDAEDVHIITRAPETQYHDISLSLTGKYRYFRYLAPKGSRGDLAELEIYDRNDSLLCGEIIGDNTSFYWFGFSNKYKAFDGDVTTIFEADKFEGAWLGMDFKNPVEIGKFSYLPHNTDNFIRKDETYELFYWEKEWRSLGRQKGNRIMQTVRYKVPATALLKLSSPPKERKEERVFVYKDGKQIWF